MTLREITKLINGQVHTGKDRIDEEVSTAFASDLMSDVLTLKSSPLLLSGLCNVQTIRTCDMACIDHIVIVRNKKPNDEMIELAEENDMVLITSEYSLFKVCGILYAAGIQPLF